MLVRFIIFLAIVIPLLAIIIYAARKQVNVPHPMGHLFDMKTAIYNWVSNPSSRQYRYSRDNYPQYTAAELEDAEYILQTYLGRNGDYPAYNVVLNTYHAHPEYYTTSQEKIQEVTSALLTDFNTWRNNWDAIIAEEAAAR